MRSVSASARNLRGKVRGPESAAGPAVRGDPGWSEPVHGPWIVVLVLMHARRIGDPEIQVPAWQREAVPAEWALHYVLSQTRTL